MDDPNEPFMDGSDQEFSDLDEEEDDADDDNVDSKTLLLACLTTLLQVLPLAACQMTYQECGRQV